MSKTNKKGFSLAELLISLLIISIVLAAAIPTITKRSGASREQIWRWTTSNNDIFFGVGSKQSAILGLSAMPSNVEYFYSGYKTGNNEGMSSDTDKLAIAQQYNDDEKFFQKSQIAFYTAKKTADATATDGIEYAGRLALDRKNIALGIGTLQALANDKLANTAIGHYALFHNATGEYNTALGFLALPNNTTGSSNTAFGYSALSKINKIKDEIPSNNNVAIGAGACSGILSGSNNICIGSNSGNDPNGGIGAVVPGKEYTDIEDRIFIGSHIVDNSNGQLPATAGNNADLITGYTNYKSNTYDKELNVNARRFNVKTFDGQRTMIGFSTATYPEVGGINAQNYKDNSTKFSSNAYFDVYADTTDKNNSLQTQLAISGDTEQVNLNVASADTTNNKGKININQNALTVRFNNPKAGEKERVDIEAKNDLGISSETASVGISAQQITLSGKGETTANVSAPYGLNLTADKEKEITITSLKNLNLNGLEALNAYSPTVINLNTQKIINANAQESINLISKGIANLQAKSSINIKTTDSTGIINIGQLIVQNDTAKIKNITVTDVTINSLGSVKHAIEDLYSKVGNSGYSDIRLKDVSGDNTAGLKEINELNVKNYTYKNDKEKTPHVGVIAQDLQKVFPNSVFKAKDGYFKIKTEEIFYAMVNSIKELCAQIQDLTAKVTGLDKRITELEKQNQLLKKQNADFEKRLTKLEKQKK